MKNSTVGQVKQKFIRDEINHNVLINKLWLIGDAVGKRHNVWRTNNFTSQAINEM